MALHSNASVSLGLEPRAIAERMLASGRYGNLSEVVQSTLCLLGERKQGFQTRSDKHQAFGAVLEASGT